MKIQPLLERVAATIKGYVDKRVDALDMTIKSLPTPRDGKDGAEPSDERIDALIAKRIPDPIPGRDGVDGKDAPPVDIEAVAAIVVKQIPVPKDGRDGADGRDGIDGKSFTLEDVQSIVTAAITQKQAEWALDFERRATERHDRWLASLPLPKDGKDGKDAFGLKDFSAAVDSDGRTVLLTFKNDERTEHAHLTFPVVIDRGVWKEKRDDGFLYEKGDGVSFGGSFWIAQVDDPQGKPEVSKDWRLAIKRGRDGKDGRNGIDKTAPVKT